MLSVCTGVNIEKVRSRPACRTAAFCQNPQVGTDDLHSLSAQNNLFRQAAQANLYTVFRHRLHNGCRVFAATTTPNILPAFQTDKNRPSTYPLFRIFRENPKSIFQSAFHRNQSPPLRKNPRPHLQRPHPLHEELLRVQPLMPKIRL